MTDGEHCAFVLHADVFICKMRKKLAKASRGKNYIETVWGLGYILREPIEDETRLTA